MALSISYKNPSSIVLLYYPQYNHIGDNAFTENKALVNYSMSGQKVRTYQPNMQNNTIYLGHLKPAKYLAVLYQDGKVVEKLLFYPKQKAFTNEYSPIIYQNPPLIKRQLKQRFICLNFVFAIL